MGSYFEHKHDPFIKWISHINPNMTWTRLASTHDLFINKLVISGSQVVSDFATSKKYIGKKITIQNNGCDSHLKTFLFWVKG